MVVGCGDDGGGITDLVTYIKRAWADGVIVGIFRVLAAKFG